MCRPVRILRSVLGKSFFYTLLFVRGGFVHSNLERASPVTTMLFQQQGSKCTGDQGHIIHAVCFVTYCGMLRLRNLKPLHLLFFKYNNQSYLPQSELTRPALISAFRKLSMFNIWVTWFTSGENWHRQGIKSTRPLPLRNISR